MPVPGCSGTSVQIPNWTLFPGETAYCEATLDIQFGPDVIISTLANLSLRAPKIAFTGPITIESGAKFSVPSRGLNDTGITLCSDADTTGLTCPVAGFPGQDAEYGRDVSQNITQDGHAGFSFTKLDANGNPLSPSVPLWACVRDNVTDLTWEVKTDDGGLRDKDNTYTWYNPDPNTNGGDPGTQNGGSCTGEIDCDTEAYVQAVNLLGLCGASDWRVPSRVELKSLVNLGRYNPAIDTDYFPNTRSWNYWSASPYADITPGSAWYVYYYNGYLYDFAKTGNLYVRLVCGGQ